MRTETLVLGSLLNSEDYMRKVLPYMREEYFHDQTEQQVFREYKRFVDKYNTAPTLEALTINFNRRDDLSDDSFDQIVGVMKDMQEFDASKQDMKYLVETSEKWCQDRAIYNAIQKSIKIFDGREQISRDMIPDILSDALRVSFDSNVGHDFINDHEDRFEFYHNEEERVPTGLEYFDLITMNGFPKKTLNVILAGTNVGKTLVMCSLAATMLDMGKNVLYITMEMAEEAIAQRIDQNLLNAGLEELMKMKREDYLDRFDQKVKSKTRGKLLIKEYPTATAHVGHFRHLVKELRIKKNFKPDIIFIDYLGICASSRTKLGGTINSYSYVKFIAEEVRGLAKELELPIFTGAQSNRGGQSAAELSLEDTAESFGLPQTADWMIGITETPQLAEMNQFLCVQLKNRYRDKNRNRAFVIGVDKDKQRLYDVDQEAQRGIDPDGTPKEDEPIFDKTGFGKRNRSAVKEIPWEE